MHSVLLALSAILGAKNPPAPPPLPLPDSTLLQVGLWLEARPGVDSSAARRWGDELVAKLDRRVATAGQRARLARMVLLPQGTRLPLAGGDPRHHPDLRATDLDLVWGIPGQDSLGESTAQRILRTWLTNRGCLDERGFAVGWDLFHLPRLAANALDSSAFPVDAHHAVHWPRWSLLPDSGTSLQCLRALAKHPAGKGVTYSDLARQHRETHEQLRTPLDVRLSDALGHPVTGAVLELWRGLPDSRRPYASRFQGAPDTLRSDSTGRFPVHTPLAWLSDANVWNHGPEGSRGVSYWRITYGQHRLTGWLDAHELLSLPSEQDTLRLARSLPAGSSRSWKEAAARWPRPWLAAETDANGALVLGLSTPEPLICVLRLVDPLGREKARTRTLEFPAGVHERHFDWTPGPGEWDLRLDSPSSRLQVRLERGERLPPAPPANLTN